MHSHAHAQIGNARKEASSQMRHIAKLIDATASKALSLSSFSKQARPERACMYSR